MSQDKWYYVTDCVWWIQFSVFWLYVSFYSDILECRELVLGKYIVVKKNEKKTSKRIPSKFPHDNCDLFGSDKRPRSSFGIQLMGEREICHSLTQTHTHSPSPECFFPASCLGFLLDISPHVLTLIHIPESSVAFMFRRQLLICTQAR